MALTKEDLHYYQQQMETFLSSIHNGEHKHKKFFRSSLVVIFRGKEY